MNTKRSEIYIGKTGTGKTTLVKSLLPDALYFYANEIEIVDVYSIPIELGIIIEDVDFKPNTKEIVKVIRSYRGTVVLTSKNRKSIPKEILNICKVKNVGTKKYLRETVKGLAPRSEEPFSFERDVFTLINDYLRNSDRELIKDLLLFNKPSDTQMISWLTENLHPNKLLFIDGVVKRRWPQEYFYEMLSYTHDGKLFRKTNMAQRGKYSKAPRLLKRVGLKPDEERLFKQLIESEDFAKFAKKKYNNEECRLMGLGEKKVRKDKPKKPKIKTLEDFF